MTSQEKLAKILAMRRLYKIIHAELGVITFSEMMDLVKTQSYDGLSNGEADALGEMKAVLTRKDNGTLEADMRQLDSFKEALSKQNDEIVARIKTNELAG